MGHDVLDPVFAYAKLVWTTHPSRASYLVLKA
jgi:hypothetical protein